MVRSFQLRIRAANVVRTVVTIVADDAIASTMPVIRIVRPMMRSQLACKPNIVESPVVFSFSRSHYLILAYTMGFDLGIVHFYQL